MQRVDRPGPCDRGTVLIVVKHRDLEEPEWCRVRQRGGQNDQILNLSQVLEPCRPLRVTAPHYVRSRPVSVSKRCSYLPRVI
jgi:hypothetical protein